MTDPYRYSEEGAPAYADFGTKDSPDPSTHTMA